MDNNQALIMICKLLVLMMKIILAKDRANAFYGQQVHEMGKFLESL